LIDYPVLKLWKKNWGTLTSEQGAEIETPKNRSGEGVLPHQPTKP